MALTNEVPLNKRLEEDEKAKNQTLGAYYNQVNSGSTTPSATSNYSNYLSNQNASLQKQTTPGTYDRSKYNLSSYDQGLNQAGINEVTGGKDLYAQGQATGNQAMMDEGYLKAQLGRAIHGGYIDNVGDGTGYQAFGYGNLTAAERNMAVEDQNEILRAKLGYMYAKTDADRAYWRAYAEKIRNKYGFSGGEDGSGYVELKNDDKNYRGYDTSQTGGLTPYDAYKQYSDQINQLNRILMDREYDPESDPAYLAYRDQYTRNGNAAANAAMAQAAGNTGGIANSYANAVAAAAQQAYAKQLTDIIPQLQQQQIADRQNLLSSILNQQQSAYNVVAGERAFDFDRWLQEAQLAKTDAALAWEQQKEKEARDWETEQLNIDRRLAGYNV